MGTAVLILGLMAQQPAPPTAPKPEARREPAPPTESKPAPQPGGVSWLNTLPVEIPLCARFPGAPRLRLEPGGKLTVVPATPPGSGEAPATAPPKPQ
jgi:hypothetical protein